MSEKSIPEEKGDFLRITRRFWGSSTPKGFECACIRVITNSVRGDTRLYKPKTSLASTLRFRKDLKKELCSLVHKHADAKTDDENIENILSLADKLSGNFSPVLAGNFRIGLAQMLVNLHLKYLWAANLIPSAPLHCPFDGTVLRYFPQRLRQPPWTKMDSVADYQNWIAAAKERAGDDSVAVWELREYNRRPENRRFL